jgi:Pyruvate/2-oxoacid:ferredoxin oxidoreductase gamma subunit
VVLLVWRVQFGGGGGGGVLTSERVLIAVFEN